MSNQFIEINLIVNGKSVQKNVSPRLLLVDFLRHDLHLTGTHVGCEHGVCGAWNIDLDGKTARSCLLFAVQVDGAVINTVESLGTMSHMHPLQESFWEKHGLQCGFCTPGMLMSANELLKNNPNPTRDEVIEAISSNLCRCTGYQTIVDAVLSAAQEMKKNEVTTS